MKSRNFRPARYKSYNRWLRWTHSWPHIWLPLELARIFSCAIDRRIVRIAALQNSGYAAIVFGTQHSEVQLQRRLCKTFVRIGEVQAATSRLQTRRLIFSSGVTSWKESKELFSLSLCWREQFVLLHKLLFRMCPRNSLSTGQARYNWNWKIFKVYQRLSCSILHLSVYVSLVC